MFTRLASHHGRGVFDIQASRLHLLVEFGPMHLCFALIAKDRWVFPPEAFNIDLATLQRVVEQEISSGAAPALQILSSENEMLPNVGRGMVVRVTGREWFPGPLQVFVGAFAAWQGHCLEPWFA